MQSKRLRVISPGTRPLILTALTLLGFALRAARLDFQSLWHDEVAGVVNSLPSLSTITLWVAANEPHPPLHYYILHLWMLAAGSSELAVRFPSVVFGTASIPAAYLLLRQLTGPNRALLGAAALTASAFHIFYSQEARMHVEASAFVILAAWALFSVNRRGGAWRWFGYAAAAVAALYTFYYTALVLLVLNLPILFRRRASRPGWWLANSIAVVTLVPWLLLTLRATRRFAGEPLPGGTALNIADLPRSIVAYGFGVTANVPLSAIPSAGLLIALLLCACRLLRRRSVIDEQLILWAFLPPLAIYFSTLVAVGAADSAPRLMLICLPAWIALLVRGWPANWRLPAPAWGVLALALALPTAAALAANYTNPNTRDNYRAAFQLLRRQGMPDEALIYDTPDQAPALTYYYANPNLPAFGLPSSPSRDQTEATLAQLARQYNGFWALLYGEPRPWVEDWLHGHMVAVSDEWVGPYVRLAHFLAAPLPAGQELDGAVRVNATFGPMQLLQLRLLAPTPDTSSVALDALWTLQAPATADYVRSFQLFDTAGSRVAQSDSPPLNGALPTSNWKPGSSYEDPVVLHPADPLSAGVYTLKATLYASAADPFPQATVLRFLYDPHARAVSLDTQSNAGWTINQASLSAQPNRVLLQLDGTVRQTPATDYTWFAHLIDAQGRMLAQDDHPPLAPTSAWRPGDHLTETFDLAPGDGQARAVELGAYDSAGGRAEFTLAGGQQIDHLTVPLG